MKEGNRRAKEGEGFWSFVRKKEVNVKYAMIIVMVGIVVLGRPILAQDVVARLSGFAKLSWDTFIDPPADSPLRAGSGFWVTPSGGSSWRRQPYYGMVECVSFVHHHIKTGVYLPIPKHPIQGFSGIVAGGDGTYWVIVDNGYGTKANSPDYHLMIVQIQPDWETHTVSILKVVFLHDPDRVIPFHIVHENTEKRYLTGADLDPESIQKIGPYFYIGDEFGPFLIKVSMEGKVVGFWEIPHPTIIGKFLRSPDHPAVGVPSVPGTVTFDVRRSRGLEGMARSLDGRYLYLLLEGPIYDVEKNDWENKDGKHFLRIYEFDVLEEKFTGRTWKYLLEDNANNIGDFNMIGQYTGLIVERDWGEGEPEIAAYTRPARFKRVYKIDLRADPEGFVKKLGYIDLMNIDDPADVNNDGKTTYTMPFVTIENVDKVDDNHIIVANDNNFGFSAGRRPGLQEDTEVALIRVPPDFLKEAR